MELVSFFWSVLDEWYEVREGKLYSRGSQWQGSAYSTELPWPRALGTEQAALCPSVLSNGT